VNSTSTILIGDSIENLANARVMMAAARMFGVECAFVNIAPTDLLGSNGESDVTRPDGDRLPLITLDAATARYSQVIACDNLPDARELYGFRAAPQFALLVGNERRGLTYSSRRVATEAVQIPMQSQRINCLNVAAAAAVALNYLTRIRVGPMARVADPASRRPEVLLAAATDHIELGSAIRSAAAFGWSRILIDDCCRVWFGVDRVVRSEGRAAARRARNDIRLVPVTGHAVIDVPEVVVVTVASTGTPLHRLDLSHGSRQLIVVPDEGAGLIDPETMERNGRRLRVASVDLSRRSFPYHYRLIASLVLAEVARQVGVYTPREGRRKARPEYMFQLPVSMEAAGESISLTELEAY
jgi:tRNA G18 (ribose-2'-O)-methylase SpoU